MAKVTRALVEVGNENRTLVQSVTRGSSGWKTLTEKKFLRKVLGLETPPEEPKSKPVKPGMRDNIGTAYAPHAQEAIVNTIYEVWPKRTRVVVYAPKSIAAGWGKMEENATGEKLLDNMEDDVTDSVQVIPGRTFTFDKLAYDKGPAALLFDLKPEDAEKINDLDNAELKKLLSRALGYGNLRAIVDLEEISGKLNKSAGRKELIDTLNPKTMIITFPNVLDIVTARSQWLDVRARKRQAVDDELEDAMIDIKRAVIQSLKDFAAGKDVVDDIKKDINSEIIRIAKLDIRSESDARDALEELDELLNMVRGHEEQLGGRHNSEVKAVKRNLRDYKDKVKAAFKTLK
jgi:hypothetical protein